MSPTSRAREWSSVAVALVLVGGCYSSHRRAEAVERDGGVVDAPVSDAPFDAGALPSCDELFARTPDVVNDTPYVDATCTETTLPLQRSYLEIWAPGGAAIRRSCYVVTRAYSTSGWAVGARLSADGPGVQLRVAGPSLDPDDERVLWEVRAFDAAGRVIAGRAESLRIGRATPTAYGARVLGLASVVPSLWASEGQVNAGLYGHPTFDARSLRLATLGATWLTDSPRPTFSWVFPDEQVRSLEVPGVTSAAHVVEWLDADGEHWRLIEGQRMVAIRGPVPDGGPLVLEGTTTLADLPDAHEVALDGTRLLIQDGTNLYAFDARDGTPLGVVASDVAFLLPTGALHTDMRLEVLGTAGEDRQFTLDDFRLASGLIGYAGDGLLVGRLGVIGSVDLPGPRFASYESAGIPGDVWARSPVTTNASADVLYTGADGADRAQRLSISFRGCD